MKGLKINKYNGFIKKKWSLLRNTSESSSANSLVPEYSECESDWSSMRRSCRRLTLELLETFFESDISTIPIGCTFSNYIKISKLFSFALFDTISFQMITHHIKYNSDESYMHSHSDVDDDDAVSHVHMISKTTFCSPLCFWKKLAKLWLDIIITYSKNVIRIQNW